MAMKGKEPAAFNFVDLSGEATADDRSAATTSLLRRAPMIPSAQPVDTLRNTPPPYISDRLFRHPGSSIMNNRVNSRMNNSSYFHRPVDRPNREAVPGRPCQSWGTQRLVAAPRLKEDNISAQVASRLKADNPAQVEFAQVATSDLVKERELHDQARMLGNHLTLASSSLQAAAEFDRIKQARKDFKYRQKQLMLVQEASNQRAIIQRRQEMILAMQATHEQAASINANPERASQSMHKGVYNTGAWTSPSHHYGTVGPDFANPPAHYQRPSHSPMRVPLGTSMNPPNAPLENQGVAIVDKMIKAPAIPGSLNWTYQQQQLCGPDLQAANSLRAGGSGCKHYGTAQMTIFYASLVNVYDDVPLDLAQAVCMMLTGQKKKRPPDDRKCWPPRSQGSPTPVKPQARPRARPRPSPTPPSTHMSAPSTPMSMQSRRVPQPPSPQVPTASEAGPSCSAQEPGAVLSSVRQRTVTTGELPQARKASLARFLERRKDRVQSKLKKIPSKMEGEGGSPPCDKSPSPASIRKVPTKSPSPAPSAYNPRHALFPSFSDTLLNQPGAPSSSKSTSPTRPPPTPPRQYFSHEKIPGTTSKRRSFEQCIAEEEDLNKRARSVYFLMNDKPPTTLAATATTEYVMSEYHEVLKEFDLS